MKLYHDDKPSCDLCEWKLREAHPYLQSWFRRVKSMHPSVHISCAWRNQEDQEKAYNEGKSKAHYPNSPHNFMIGDKPCSLALDLFQIDADGMARFSWKFYELVAKESAEQDFEVVWGGTFKSLRDGPHYQLSAKIALPSVA
jgi:peptidoglycan LD-endopeptidase CwlK